MSRQFDLGLVKGQDFQILGFYSSLADLRAAVPDPPAGAAYGVGTEEAYDIYIWDAVGLDWVNNGPVGFFGPITFDAYDLTLWTIGTLTAANGTNSSVNYRIRTEILSKGVKKVTPQSGYKMLLYIYDADGVYQGVWTGSGTEKATTNNWFTSAVDFANLPAGSQVRLVASDVNDSTITTATQDTVAQNIILTRYTDDSLSRSGIPADAATVGSAIYRSKNRALHKPAALTYWDISEAFDDSTSAAPANMPANSYTYTSGARLAGFNNSVFTLTGVRNYFVFCWANLHGNSTAVRYYEIIAPSYNQHFVGRTIDGGTTVDWADWSPDSGLAIEGAPADAAAVGAAIYRTKNRERHMPAAFTWWEISEAYTPESPASPANIPVNSYTYTSGSRLAGFNNAVFTLTGVRNYFVFCWASLHNTPTRFYQIFSPSYDQFFVGRTNDSGATVEWSDWSPRAKKTTSVMFFGDSIVRGSTGSGLSTNRIPNIVASELGIRCENFGIGNIGWLNTGGTNKTNALGYLQRVGNSDYYDSSDTWSGYKFLGSGDWSDFNTIVLSLGPNDGNYALGSVQTDIIDAGLDAMSYADIMALTPTKIVVAMYQCYRYIRNISSTINIIISDPLISKGNSGVPPLWSYNLRIGTGAWSRHDLCDLYAEFCPRYGLGHITNMDAPLDRVDITNSLADNVHPKSATYKALGLHFAGKILALSSAASAGSSGPGAEFWFGTLAEYNALSVIDPDVCYFIEEGT